MQPSVPVPAKWRRCHTNAFYIHVVQHGFHRNIAGQVPKFRFPFPRVSIWQNRQCSTMCRYARFTCTRPSGTDRRRNPDDSRSQIHLSPHHGSTGLPQSQANLTKGPDTAYSGTVHFLAFRKIRVQSSTIFSSSSCLCLVGSIMFRNSRYQTHNHVRPTAISPFLLLSTAHRQKNTARTVFKI